jgi:phosphoribosylaminoimidazole-succinocarboxamide synthase
MGLKIEGLERLYQGKTKDVYRYTEGQVLLHAKDAVTGWKVKNADGTISVVEDPGANEVIGEIDGLGLKNVKSSIYYFELFKDKGLETHYIDSDLEAKTMLVHEAESIGHGLECIVRFKAMGSILRAFPDYLTEGQELHDFFEITTKNDEAGDPRISKELLSSVDFGVAMSEAEYDECKEMCLKAAKVMKADLAASNLELVDIKFEIGKVDNKIVLIDEISAGIMRVYNGDVQLSEEELGDVLVEKFASK